MNSSKPQSLLGCSLADDDLSRSAVVPTQEPSMPFTSDSFSATIRQREDHDPESSKFILPPIRALLAESQGPVVNLPGHETPRPMTRKRVFSDGSNVHGSVPVDILAHLDSSLSGTGPSPSNAASAQLRHRQHSLDFPTYASSAEIFHNSDSHREKFGRISKRAKVENHDDKRDQRARSHSYASSSKSQLPFHDQTWFEPNQSSSSRLFRPPIITASSSDYVPRMIEYGPQASSSNYRRPSLSQQSDSSHYTSTSASGSVSSYSYPRSALSAQSLPPSSHCSASTGSHASLTPPPSYRTNMNSHHQHPRLTARGFPTKVRKVRTEKLSSEPRAASWVSRFNVSLSHSHSFPELPTDGGLPSSVTPIPCPHNNQKGTFSETVPSPSAHTNQPLGSTIEANIPPFISLHGVPCNNNQDSSLHSEITHSNYGIVSYSPTGSGYRPAAMVSDGFRSVDQTEEHGNEYTVKIQAPGALLPSSSPRRENSENVTGKSEQTQDAYDNDGSDYMFVRPYDSPHDPPYSLRKRTTASRAYIQSSFLPPRSTSYARHEVDSTLHLLIHPQISGRHSLGSDKSNLAIHSTSESNECSEKVAGIDTTPVYSISDASSDIPLFGSTRKLWELPLIISN